MGRQSTGAVAHGDAAEESRGQVGQSHGEGETARLGFGQLRVLGEEDRTCIRRADARVADGQGYLGQDQHDEGCPEVVHRKRHDPDAGRTEGQNLSVEATQQVSGRNAQTHGGDGRRHPLVVEQEQHEGEDDEAQDQVDVRIRKMARHSRHEEVLRDDQLDPLPEEHQSQRKLDAPNHWRREEFRQPVHDAGQGEQQEHASENHARRADDGFRDFARKGDGDGTHGLQRLNRHGKFVIPSCYDVENAEREEDGRWAELVDEDHADDNREQGPQVAERPRQFDAIESEIVEEFAGPAAWAFRRRGGSFSFCMGFLSHMVTSLDRDRCGMSWALDLMTRLK
ncbi:hypothetical protein DSECCO2_496770 [anaerobic digester metagenome]